MMGQAIAPGATGPIVALPSLESHEQLDVLSHIGHLNSCRQIWTKYVPLAKVNGCLIQAKIGKSWVVRIILSAITLLLPAYR